MKKQFNPWGCGLYAVSNACNFEDFITEERLEKSKLGNTIGQLSKWMQEDGKPFYIEVLYYNHQGKKLPNSALKYKPMDTNPLSPSIKGLPVLINVRSTENSKNHLIGGKIDLKGVLHLYDSLKPEPIKTTLGKVNKMYAHVYGLFIFANVETGEYAFI